MKRCDFAYCPDCGERLKRGEGSGALTGFSDAKRAEEPGSAEEEGAKRPEPQSLAVSPVEAEALANKWSIQAAELNRQLYAMSLTGKHNESAPIWQTAASVLVDCARELRALYIPALKPESEQGENAGDGKPSQESPEAGADPNYGTASGRRNAEVRHGAKEADLD